MSPHGIETRSGAWFRGVSVAISLINLKSFDFKLRNFAVIFGQIYNNSFSKV